MQATRPTSSTGQGLSIRGATLQQSRRWESTYTTVSWDYPPSPAAHYDALLTRGASHSRFLRIAYLSTRHRFTSSLSYSPPLPSPSSADTLDASTHLSSHHPGSRTPPISPHRNPALRPSPRLPYPILRSCAQAGGRSAYPTPHVLGRRKPQWPKPPYYHAALLRKPVCRRRGLFRGVLPPEQAVDFFRWDVLGAKSAPSARSSFTPSESVSRWAVASVHVVESVLEPYEAAAGFSGWHGLGVDVARRVRGSDKDERVRYWSRGLRFEQDDAGACGSSALRFEIDEAAVEEGRALWARAVEELVGPPGLVLRSVVEHGMSGKVAPPSDHPTRKDAFDARRHPPPPIFSRREEVRWAPDTGTNPLRLPRAVSDEKWLSPPSVSVRDSSPNSNSEHKSDSPSAWWHGPASHRGPAPTPHLPSLRFLPPPSIQYGPPPVHFSPWFPSGRVPSAQGHGYWFGAQPVGAPSSALRDSTAKSVLPHSHVFTAPSSSVSTHPAQSSRYPDKPSLGRDEYGPSHDDKETETDHGYESTTTTTDSDPPPRTPIGAATSSHCVEALRVHGDDEVEVHGVDIDGNHAAASVTIRLSDPSTPAKLHDRFTASTSPSLSSGSPNSRRESSKEVVMFPSLNGSFCQGSASRSSVTLSAQTTPARTVTPVSSSSSFTRESTQPGLGDEDLKTKLSQEPSGDSVSGDGPAFTLSLCSPPSTSPRPGFRKDSQGFWEPVTPASPSSSSSSSSLPLSPSDRKMGNRPAAGRIGERMFSGESSESSEDASPSRSWSQGSGTIASEGWTRGMGSQPASLSSPTPTSPSVFGGPHPSSSSLLNGAPSPSPNPTTLLPAFLATPSVKRKKASRTREIVDRLRSSSIDAGKDVGLDSLSWLAGSIAGEGEGKLGKASTGADHAGGNNVAASQSSPPPSTPSRPRADSGSWVASEMDKGMGEVQGSKTCDSGSSGSGGRTTQTGLESHLSNASSRTTNPGITPFPILSVSQSQSSSFAMTRPSQCVGTAIATPSKTPEGPKMNASATTSPTARSGLPLVPTTPNGGASPIARPCHHPLPSPVHPPPPALGPPPPPILTVSPYPHPMYTMPFPPYHLAPAHQGQQGPGTWVTVYPGRPPPHVPVHPIPAPITGVSGMRHVSW